MCRVYLAHMWCGGCNCESDKLDTRVKIEEEIYINLHSDIYILLSVQLARENQKQGSKLEC